MAGLVPAIHVLQDRAKEKTWMPATTGMTKHQERVMASLQQRTEVRDGMRIDWNVPITMDDGLELRADIFRPVKDGKFEQQLRFFDHFLHGKKDGWAKQPKVQLLVRHIDRFEPRPRLNGRSSARVGPSSISIRRR